MKNKITILLILSSFSLFAQRRGKAAKYVEKMAKVDPTYTCNLNSLLLLTDSTEQKLITEFDITKEANLIVDSIAILNKNINYIKGYKVLAYSGSSQYIALEIRKEILKSLEKHPDFTTVKTEFLWHQPTFRIYVGAYQKRLKAVRMAQFIKYYQYKFASAKTTINPLVVPSKISIRKK